MSLKQAVLELHDRQKLISELEPYGYRLEIERPEVLHFHGPVRLDILLARRPISREMLSRAGKTDLLGEIKFLRAEDLISLKIQAYCNDKQPLLGLRFKGLGDPRHEYYEDYESYSRRYQLRRKAPCFSNLAPRTAGRIRSVTHSRWREKIGCYGR